MTLLFAWGRDITWGIECGLLPCIVPLLARALPARQQEKGRAFRFSLLYELTLLGRRFQQGPLASSTQEMR
ncbi:hypothetical protein CCMA1212_007622 [Trichoderma ghanense]|uniref:Uncharacterized protein n=1 Tax=Trichoderma ghanense TaxID=65468 RepID=A0ABY2GW66_9HYPO